MSEQSARLVDQLRARLRATIQRMTLAETAFGAVITAGTIAAVWLLFAALEAGLWMGTTLRAVLIGIVAAAMLGLFAYFLARPLLQLLGLWAPPPEEAVARRIGQHYPEVSDRLVNVLQLAEGRRSPAPDAFVDRAVQSLSEEIESIEFEHVEDFSRARAASRLASLPIAGLLIFLIAAPGTFLDASQRLLAPGTSFERPAPFQLEVTPGDIDLVRGDSLEITVRATGNELPQTLTIATGQEDEDEEAVEHVTVRADSAGVFRHTLPNVRQPMRYRVEAAPVTSPWYSATVEARPLVRALQVTLTPPAYTRLPDRRLDANVGDVTGLPGTRVSLRADLGGPDVTHAVVAFDDGARDTLAVEDGVATGQFTLNREGSYRIRLRSANEVPNRDPIRYSMELRADAEPSVVFLAPDPVTDLPESLEQPLRLRVSDDFGITRLRLFYRVIERQYGTADSAFAAFDLPVESPRESDQRIDYRWALDEYGLDLAPGDVVEYYARVWDNDAVAGYKSARTQTQRLRLPSLAEQYEQLDAEQDGAQQQMEDMMQETESIRQQFDELRNELRRKQEGDWEDQRQLEQLQERQQQLESDAESLSQQVEEMTRQMEESSLASPETLEMYRELQQVIEEINSPELMDALQQLQKAMQDLNLEQMQEAMQDFEFNEEQYQERLQRSLELFKQIRMQQKLEEAARRSGDLSEQQQRLAEETERRQNESDVDDDAASSDGKNSESEAEGTAPDEGQPQSAEPDSANAATEEATAPDVSENASDSGQGDADAAAGDQAPDTPPSNEDLAQEQERASEEMRQLQERLQEMRDEMGDLRSAPQQEMQELMQQMREQNLPEQMQQNSQQLRQDQLQDAQQGQQQMQQQLQQMQQQLQQMQQNMQGQQQQMNLSGLRQALENTLLLSRNQEDLRHNVNTLSSDSPTLRRLAQDQVSLSEGLRTVSDSLQALARQVPQMTRAVQRETGDALQEMQRATEALSERNAGMASGHQRGSMMHLNELALLLSDLLDQMMQGGGGGGMSMEQMLQQLQQMSGDQEQLNEQIQQMLNDMQGNRLSVDEQERLEQMARQQEAIKRQLEELNRENGGRNQLMGDLERIAEQMEETIQELQENQTDRRTIERQQQILTRLLNAQKSLQQQGQEEEREGQESEDSFDNRESPGELSREEQIDRLRRDLIRALETGYAPDYEELIKRYFELLQEQE